MKENSVKNISEEIGEFAFERFSDLHDWQKAARKKLKEITGLDRMEAMVHDAAPPEILWERDMGLGRISKISFFPEPGRAGIRLSLPAAWMQKTVSRVHLSSRTRNRHALVAGGEVGG